MRGAGTVAALAALLLALGVPAALAGPPATTPSSTGTTPSSTSTTQAVPPPAPRPTDSGNSPAAPDPHPPGGGIGPQGQAVGGRRLLGRGLVLPAHASPPPADLTARAWVVADLDTGQVIAARDPHGRYQPASIQKLLTTVTLLPLLPGARRVTVSRRAADTEGSHAGLIPGGRYTIDQIFRGLLLVSGNDCAEALAEAAGGRAPTVARMNATARDLGAVDTYVQTPSGLDGWRQLTSAYDMTLFLRAALARPRFVAYDTARTSILPVQRRQHVGAVLLANQNVRFLTTVRGALAAKTGYTDAAGHTFAGAIRRDGHRYGVVLMRAQRWPKDQWQQAVELVRWARSLPAGSAVGRLASSVTTLRATAGSSSTAMGSPTPPSPSGSTGTRGSRSTSAVRLVVLVGLVGGLFLLTQRLRRPRSR